MYLIVCMGFADGGHCDTIGQYLQTYDPEFQNGLGIACWTPDLEKAMKFGQPGDAFSLWRQVSATRPSRADGKPNKPLTAYSVTIVRDDEVVDPAHLSLIEIAKEAQS